MKKTLAVLLVLMLLASTLSAFAEFEPVKKGSKGDRVVEIQECLIKEGFLSGKADGDFGKGTEGAVIAFQEANGIDVTGIVDENTYDILTGNIPPEELIEIDLERVDRNTLDSDQRHFAGVLENGQVFAVFNTAPDNNSDFYSSRDHGECDVSGWSDIVSIAVGGDFTLGLKSNGTVVGTGSQESYKGIKKWSGIIDIACAWQIAVGLKMDGTVVITGYPSDSYAKCNVGNWTDIVDISAGGAHIIGLKSDGTVLATGRNDEGQCNVSGWTDIVAIAGNDWATFGLKEDGTVVYAGGSRNGQFDAVKRWSNIADIIACNEDVFGIKTDGTAVDADESSFIQGASCVNIASVSSTEVLLQPDGTLKCNRAREEFNNLKLQVPVVYDDVNSEISSESQNTGIWSVQAFVDEFNLPTDEYYIVNSSSFGGSFSNSATTNSSLSAYVFCSQYENDDILEIRLLEYGQSRVNNPYSKTRYYDIAIMDCDGNKYYTEGAMYSNSYDVSVIDEQPVLDALKKGGTVRLAITERDNTLTKYIITIEDATGFSVAYYEYWNK